MKKWSVLLCLTLFACANNQEKSFPIGDAAPDTNGAVITGYVDKIVDKHKHFIKEKYLNKDFYVGQSVSKLKNGELAKVISLRIKDKPTKKIDYNIVRAAVTLKQESERHDVEISSVYDDNGKLIKRFLRPSTEKGSITSDAVLLNEDPLKKHRKNEKVIKAINERKVYVGMPGDAVVLSYGPAMKINTSVGATGKLVQLVYPGGTYVHIHNEKVSNISQSSY